MKKLLFPAVLLCVFLPASILAQTANATLGGTVSDATGALIPGVTITATNTATGIVTTVVSNEAGAYQFASLQPGNYKVNSELPGFQTQAYSDVALGGGQQVRLNFTLQVGTVAQAVEVTAAADTLLATTSSSIGSVLPEYKVRDLPLASRNVFGLLATTPGAQKSAGFDGVFAGQRLSMANTVRDGISVGDGRYLIGAASATYVSPDLVDEVRVIVSPADAETARGSGQVQLTTRSGTNQYRGSLFWTNRNSALDASNWFNNFNGVPKDYYNRNQYGARLGGPIVKNKTFFFFLFEGQRALIRQSAVGTVLTDQARQGIFRFFPGVQNGNAVSNNPVVDLAGNPVKPAGATGDLQSFSVFTDASGRPRDPLRTGYDPSGWVPLAISRMPQANDFTSGDGLNTAGIRWVRRVPGMDLTNNNGVDDVDRDQWNFRIDHNISTKHKAFFSGTREHAWGLAAQSGIGRWPNQPPGFTEKTPYIYTGALISTLTSTMVNEFRAGIREQQTYAYASHDKPGKEGETVYNTLLPKYNGNPTYPIPVLFPWTILDATSNPTTRGAVSPLISFADSLSWTRGKHAFKGGVEVRKSNSDGWNTPEFGYVRAQFGAGGVPVTGIDSASVPGLIGTNQTLARNLLIDLSGSLASITQAGRLVNATDTQFKSLAELKDVDSDVTTPCPREGCGTRNLFQGTQKEFSLFFKDDWKVQPNLTFNLGVRYDYYGVPFDAKGLMAAPVGGAKGLFGISGTGYDALWQPGLMKGSLTTPEFVGKNSPNPGQQIYKDDWNNFAPAVGLSWSLPWGGKDKTVLRVGYGWTYQGAALYNTIEAIFSRFVGKFERINYTTGNYLALGNMSPLLPIPHQTKPMQPTPLTDRTNETFAFEDNHPNPYVQNWNLELQHEVAHNLTVEARYVGNKGTKLYGGIPINNVNIFENGILDAFNTTRAGGNAPLFDQMLKGLNLGSGVINGTTVTGSASLRNNTLFRGLIANGNVGGFASLLNTSSTVTNSVGGLIRNGGLPENFIVVNPQFGYVAVQGNPGNSTYHSMQLQLTKRLSHGLTNQTSYTWSKAIGESDVDFVRGQYLDPRNRALNKTLLSFHQTHSFQSSGMYELPFGLNHRFLGNAPGVVQRLVERWQLGAILSVSSGPPLTITASTSSLTENTGNTPVIVGDFPKSTGKVTRVTSGVNYFSGFQQVTDPGLLAVTSSQSTQGSYSNLAIAGSSGQVLLMNPTPGKLGTLGQYWIQGPGNIGLDMNLIKRVKITERKEFEIRLDAINVLNHPNFGTPNVDINSTNFGRITSATGSRTFVANARLNF